MNRKGRFRYGVSAALFVAVASAALAAAGPDALVPFKDAAGAATDTAVAFVIDFAGSTKPVVGCVRVPGSDNGYYALAAFLQQEGLTQPVYNDSGLLCSINGVPSSGCGQQVGDGQYIYWSYWHGSTGTWVYASTGAFAAVDSYPEPDVEGWRFQDPGPDNSNDPPPSVAPSYASICDTSTSTTTTAPPAPVATTTVTASPGQAGSTPSAAQPPVGLSGSTNTSTTAASAGHPQGSTPATKAGAAGTTSMPTTHSSRPSTSTSTVTSGQHAEAVKASAADDRQVEGNSAVPLIVGGIVVAALLAVAILRWRRRPGAP
jgi:hypothetical protein